MSTKEVYFKIMNISELPVAAFNYTYKDAKGIIQIGNFLNISFHDNIEDNLEKMKKVEEMSGFMFWNDSMEGEKWMKENNEVIKNALLKIVLANSNISMMDEMKRENDIMMDEMGK